MSSWILSNNSVNLLGNRAGAGASTLRIATNMTRESRRLSSFKFMYLIGRVRGFKNFLRSHGDICRKVVSRSKINKLRTQFSKIERARKRRAPGVMLKRLKESIS